MGSFKKFRQRVSSGAKRLGKNVKRIGRGVGRGLMGMTPLGGLMAGREGGVSDEGEVRAEAATQLRKQKRQAGAGQIEYMGDDRI